ncbi:MAG TPA: hypothetical protein VGU02_15845 [Gaiellaceae bacterium]|nr:hypothetical protein [Gaiellaceae bacterium]
MDLGAIEELRALDERDRELGAQAARIAEQRREVAAVRARAEAIDAFFAAYPASEERLRRVAATAETDLAARRAEVTNAEAALAQARDVDARAAAEKAVARANDHLEVAQLRVERAVADRDALEREALMLPGELPDLAARAAALGGEVETGPRELVEWAARADASLFVAAGQVDLQRERIIREANELASMLLGEPTYGSTPPQALARVERYWRSSPGQVSESR